MGRLLSIFPCQFAPGQMLVISLPSLFPDSSHPTTTLTYPGKYLILVLMIGLAEFMRKKNGCRNTEMRRMKQLLLQLLCCLGLRSLSQWELKGLQGLLTVSEQSLVTQQLPCLPTFPHARGPHCTLLRSARRLWLISLGTRQCNDNSTGLLTSN